MDTTDKVMSFDAAFQRLEQILEKLHSSKANLEDSLALYEEADMLMKICTKKLVEAERKIETLIKNRSNEVQVGQDLKPLTKERDFTS